MADDVLSAGRALAQALMEATVRIRRVTGTQRNQETGQVDDVWTTVYEGPARVRFPGGQPRDVDAGGQRFAESSPTVSLPVDADERITVGSSADVKFDDEGEVLTNPHDPARVGNTFRVAGPHDQTHSTARRLPVEVFTHG
ncbi:DUF6093 family protein [Microbacterium sp. QXD-8]|uniref:DUF6093 family protein n=1 Tax=Microbacterium psychrotolerans TaxID=3068321 RepID=A0ABU0Z023_9MICO|nr:DUF6093 family protein [Microbacterium sp. QXD-8]MDQ7877368.1 DUF6093 family protein [Microbacterium sp. QXD-8]